MRMKLDFTKSAQENANDCYNRAKKLREKKEGALRTVSELEKRERKLKEKQGEKEGRKIIKIVEREWYEKFHWFFTSEGLLAIGGRDAKQNETVNSKHFEQDDLFFHADIFGASVVVLKKGLNAGGQSKEETAHFAACYSSAWKEDLHSVNVYAMRREQISKSTEQGSLGTGSFMMKGEREWFRNSPLALAMFMKDERLHTVPQSALSRISHEGKSVLIKQGDMKKADAAKRISKLLGYADLDYIMQQLPAGSFEVK